LKNVAKWRLPVLLEEPPYEILEQIWNPVLVILLIEAGIVE
jgi:hypothetical protein